MSWNSTIKRGTSTLRRTPMRKAKPKARPGHDKAMLAACKGEKCYLAIPGVCRGDVETTVPCHANWSEYGKGMGIKARDVYTVPGCAACHYWLDFGPALREQKKAAWEAAYEKWERER